jgi:Cu(I)/Ag(I) efflux system membrane fusion protein
MYADVAVEGSDGEPVLAIPSDAVLDGGETQYAFVAQENDQFVPRRLTLGHRGDDWVEVHAGLSEGERVVTSANFLIDSESRLQAAIAGMGKTETNAAAAAHQH